jgi:hypothetical protein
MSPTTGAHTGRDSHYACDGCDAERWVPKPYFDMVEGGVETSGDDRAQATLADSALRGNSERDEVHYVPVDRLARACAHWPSLPFSSV